MFTRDDWSPLWHDTVSKTIRRLGEKSGVWLEVWLHFAGWATSAVWAVPWYLYGGSALQEGDDVEAERLQSDSVEAAAPARDLVTVVRRSRLISRATTSALAASPAETG